MQAVIRGVKHLDIMTPSITSTSAEAMTKLLSLLVAAFPALQHLCVNGDVGTNLLALFGAGCFKLSSLKVMTELTGDSPQHLNMIMPRLTHCVCGFTDPPSFPTRNSHPSKAGPLCLAFLSCLNLTHLDVGPLTPSPDMWHALPPRLSHMHCALSIGPPAGLHMLENLQQLELYCTDKLGINLAFLVSVLRVAPQIWNLHLSDVVREVNFMDYRDQEFETNQSRIGVSCTASCRQDSILDLIFLHNRVLAGLKVTSHSLKGGGYKGVSFTLRSGEPTQVDRCNANNLDPKDDISMLVNQLPILQAFNGVELFCDPMCGHHLMLSSLAVKFPNLWSLRLHSCSITEYDDLVPLRACTVLQHLALLDTDVTLLDATMLCTHLRSLKELVLDSSRDYFTDEDAEELKSLIQAWNFDVKLIWCM